MTATSPPAATAVADRDDADDRALQRATRTSTITRFYWLRGRRGRAR